jgi:hypothetical protein
MIPFTGQQSSAKGGDRVREVIPDRCGIINEYEIEDARFISQFRSVIEERTSEDGCVTLAALSWRYDESPVTYLKDQDVSFKSQPGFGRERERAVSS